MIAGKWKNIAIQGFGMKSYNLDIIENKKSHALGEVWSRHSKLLTLRWLQMNFRQS